MQYVLYEKLEKTVMLTLSREKALNALNNDMLTELKDVFKKISNDKNVYAIIITGSGERSFVAGADIAEMKDLNLKQACKFGNFGSSIFRQIEKSKAPVIAAINGYALGGGLELALACDLRIASENAVFGFPEVGLGIIPGYGGTQRLPRAIGLSMAKRLLYTAERIDAKKALEIGLIDEITATGGLVKRAQELAKIISAQSPVAVASVKAAVNEGINKDIDSACGIETDYFSRCFETQDQKNVMEAFLKKGKFTKFENR